MKIGEIVVLLIAHFSLQNFKVSVELWKLYIVGCSIQKIIKNFSNRQTRLSIITLFPDFGTLCAAQRHFQHCFLQKYDNLSIKLDIELLSEQSWPFYCTKLSVKIWESWTVYHGYLHSTAHQHCSKWQKNKYLFSIMSAISPPKCRRTLAVFTLTLLQCQWCVA